MQSFHLLLSSLALLPGRKPIPVVKFRALEGTAFTLLIAGLSGKVRCYQRKATDQQGSLLELESRSYLL